MRIVRTLLIMTTAIVSPSALKMVQIRYITNTGLGLDKIRYDMPMQERSAASPPRK